MENKYLNIVYDKRRVPQTGYPRALIRYLKKRYKLSSGMSVLEIGCGRGDFIKAFKDEGFLSYGIDIEDPGCEQLKGINFYKCDIRKDRLPFDDNAFDIIYHKSLIEHLIDPTNLMQESLRVLKTSGKLVMLTPDWESQIRIFFEDYTHVHPYTYLAVSDLLSIWGFKNVSSERFYQLPSVWRFPFLRLFSCLFRCVLSVHMARKITAITRCKFFRFSVELMVLGYAEK